MIFPQKNPQAGYLFFSLVTLGRRQEADGSRKQSAGGRRQGKAPFVIIRHWSFWSITRL
jgi:hypothetical protein